MISWLDLPEELKRRPGERRPPSRLHRAMILRWGPGPAGEKCGRCVALIRVAGGASQFLKCSETKVSSGASSDWRMWWPACGIFRSARKAGKGRKS